MDKTSLSNNSLPAVYPSNYLDMYLNFDAIRAEVERLPWKTALEDKKGHPAGIDYREICIGKTYLMFPEYVSDKPLWDNAREWWHENEIVARYFGYELQHDYTTTTVETFVVEYKK